MTTTSKLIILVLLFACLVVMLAGCTSTTIETPEWSIHRVSWFQDVTFPKVEVSPDGTWKMEGYKNDGGGSEAAAVVKSAVEGALKMRVP